MSNSQRRRTADLAAGRRRIRLVTGWTAAGSVLVGALAAGLLASGASAAAGTGSTPATSSTGTSSDNGGNDQLQTPQYLPGSDYGSGGGRHAGSGGS